MVAQTIRSIAAVVVMALPWNAAISATEATKQAYARPSSIPFPSDNLYSAEKAQLGKMLFFDQRLSRNFNMSCATCHNPSLGWEDGVEGAFGGQGVNLDRHSPTILNMAWGKHFFWDGRAGSLEEQARGPIEAPGEMNIPIAEVVARLENVEGYKRLFDKVFPGKGVHAEGIQKAIATYERTIVSGTAPFDRWVEGEEDAISSAAKKGFALFNGKARCSECHSGWNFTDHEFYDIGLPSSDMGRMGQTNLESDRYAFKTPGLRNILQRAPYMHNGSMVSIEQVLIHYVSGGIPRETRSDKMQPVPLSKQEIDQLAAFMATLTGEDQPVSLPILPY